MCIRDSLQKCPVSVTALPVSMSYRTYRSVRYRYWCRAELTEASGTCTDVVPNLPKCPVSVIPAEYTAGIPRYRRNIPSVCLGTYRTEHTLGILRYFLFACWIGSRSDYSSTPKILFRFIILSICFFEQLCFLLLFSQCDCIADAFLDKLCLSYPAQWPGGELSNLLTNYTTE